MSITTHLSHNAVDPVAVKGLNEMELFSAEYLY